MELPFKLTNIHRGVLITLRYLGAATLYEIYMILRGCILYGNRRDVRRISNALEGLLEVDDHVKIHSELYEVFREYPMDEKKHLDILRKELEGLSFIGLIESTNEYYNKLKQLFGTTYSYRTDEVILSSDGQNVAERIVQKRHVIVRPPPQERKKVFIACAFGYHEIENLCEEYLVPAVQGLGFEVCRIDRDEPPGSITESILQRIRSSVAVIADLTYARPSVYFEAGYAHSWGIPLLLTCHESHLEGISDTAKVHFDLAQYKISFWRQDNSGDLKWKTSDDTPQIRLKKLLKT